MDLREVKSRGELFSESRHPWELARLDVVTKKIKENIGALDNKIVFDIGCGDTFVVEELSKSFPNSHFYAIDIAFDQELIASYQNRLEGKKIKLFSSLDEAVSQLKNKTIDLILLLDVIEHIEDDVLFMKEVYEKVAVTSDTQILITVPAFQSFFTSHDVFLGHYRRYTNSQLKKNLESAGFKSDKIGYFFFSLLPIRILQWLIEKINKPKIDDSTGLTEWKGSNFKSNLLKFILMTDYHVTNTFSKFGINIVGLSNYVICKKSA